MAGQYSYCLMIQSLLQSNLAACLQSSLTDGLETVRLLLPMRNALPPQIPSSNCVQYIPKTHTKLRHKLQIEMINPLWSIIPLKYELIQPRCPKSGLGFLVQKSSHSITYVTMKYSSHERWSAGADTRWVALRPVFLLPRLVFCEVDRQEGTVTGQGLHTAVTWIHSPS